MRHAAATLNNFMHSKYKGIVFFTFPNLYDMGDFLLFPFIRPSSSFRRLGETFFRLLLWGGDFPAGRFSAYVINF